MRADSDTVHTNGTWCDAVVIRFDVAVVFRFAAAIQAEIGSISSDIYIELYSNPKCHRCEPVQTTYLASLAFNYIYLRKRRTFIIERHRWEEIFNKNWLRTILLKFDHIYNCSSPSCCDRHVGWLGGWSPVKHAKRLTSFWIKVVLTDVAVVFTKISF